MAKITPLVFLILDGWGYRQESAHNAISAAITPQWDEWWSTRPHLLLEASGEAVGLPHGQMGNSEVGHMHIGSGRITTQDLTRINLSIDNGEFNTNETILAAINSVKTTKKSLHIMGLFSPGGVHSHEQHLFALINLCKQHQVKHVYLHLITDGRDTTPQCILTSLKQLNIYLADITSIHVASITGRYYAMDRDKRWERIEPVYNLLIEGESQYAFNTAEEAINWFYTNNIHDEFIPPTRIGPKHAIKTDDVFFFFNFRADRAQQLTEAIISPTFTHFQRLSHPKLAEFVSMTHYADNLDTCVAFPNHELMNTLGEVIAKHGLRQLRLAETEKFAHVTFFLNGGKENVFPNETRILIPSPKVPTYDLQPEMSAPQLTAVIIDAIQNHKYDVIICNFANADMVGHSGNFLATVKAIETIDHALQEIWAALGPVGGQLLITADHGNAECMYNPETHQAHTAHTTQPVPLVYVGNGWKLHATKGCLIDLAPTILTLLEITPPVEMTGKPLLVKCHD